MDAVLFGKVFAFTAVDIYTRESDVLPQPGQKSVDGKAFLEHCSPRRFCGFEEVIQTDGGSEFECVFSEIVGNYCDRHRVARPYKKNEQSYFESFNRSLREECLGWAKYKPSEIPLLTRVKSNINVTEGWLLGQIIMLPKRPLLSGYR